ncbi:hypothetical protein ATANTOWER_000481 [Ataeniobius toweri]|uniref:Uncharacterized protein n=1 Tax=Ataeniobius toweri TaxID=208326 RepID=A0ABU7ALB0_9TELE|nr:hypothetical protein [Ataeniobius toweri]
MMSVAIAQMVIYNTPLSAGNFACVLQSRLQLLIAAGTSASHIPRLVCESRRNDTLICSAMCSLFVCTVNTPLSFFMSCANSRHCSSVQFCFFPYFLSLFLCSIPSVF